MRILSLLRRSALPSARNFGVVGRAALPLLASVQQPVSNLVAGHELAAARHVEQPSFNLVPIVAIPLAPPTATDPAPAAAAVQDELEKYLAMPVEKNMDLNVLEWWKAKDCKEGLPALAKMARQFLGRPASSAGVERMFSKAGKLYGDDKKGQEDESLEPALFAAANTE